MFEIELLAKKLELSPSFREYKKTELLAGRSMPKGRACDDFVVRDKIRSLLDSSDISKAPHPIAAVALSRSEPVPRPGVGVPPATGHPGGPTPQVDFSQRIADAMNMANLRQQAAASAQAVPTFPQPRMAPIPPPSAAQRPMGMPPIPIPSVASLQPANSFVAQGQGSVAQVAGENEGFILPSLPSLVIIDPNVELFRLQPKLKPIVPLAMDRAIRDIVNAGRLAAVV